VLFKVLLSDQLLASAQKAFNFFFFHVFHMQFTVQIYGPKWFVWIVILAIFHSVWQSWVLF